jgi:Xaa-Pro aminopeptidase
VANDRQMEAGDLVLMDIGAQVAGYAADITRTVPVSGTFTSDQRAIYDLVLAAEKAAEAQVRPGASPDQSLAAATQVRLQGMAALGLIQSPDATYDPPWPVDYEARPDQCLQGMLFMIHGISHGIGLEVHDPSQFSIHGEYAPGDVFTIEPGIYVNAHVLDMLPDTPKNRAFVEAVGETVRRYHEIGVRIEDDYLVTSDGVERLSTAPRELEEIEAVMAGRR